ncbi:hypothetical protein K2173_005256 [Erythroxylum novogranatense]|uniref:Leucine-rich repeat-containing N-terminal plant-type domain-containing protein n=1 Tax=Erythroxylum novogranatense TaxID=1862640 RepID=A0AAV8TV88_9ROSI|nr:hypothetical protein K2173_005256 [Erythroxylum novogranatense]
MLSWRKDVDCCKWDGVGCNTTTGRIYELMLYSFREEGFVDWHFDASLFLPFQELRRLVLQNNNIICCFERLSSVINLEHLDLSFNKIGNTILPFLGGFTLLKSLYISEIALIGTTGLEELSKLRNLEVLDLSFNDLYSSILPLLRGLHSLRTLLMSDTQQKGSINTQDLIALSNLEELDISSNNIDKFVEPKDIEGSSNITVLWLNHVVSNGSMFQLQSLKTLPKLKTLHLEWNNFTEVQISKGLSNFNNLKELYLDYSDVGNNNAFLLSIANMTSLQILSLPGCELAGSIQGTRGFCNLKNLLELDLSWNNLNGDLPHCLVNLTFLQRLDLSHNNLTGKISQSPLKILTSIKFLALSNNQFEIPSSLSLFLNHSKLKTFEAFGNEVYSEKGVINHNLEPKFQLERFYLDSSLGGGSFPEFLYHQRDLQVIYISGVTMMGLELPSWLLENNTNLKSLILSDCSLSGIFSLPIRNPNATLMYLDISRNHIYEHAFRKSIVKV